MEPYVLGWLPANPALFIMLSIAVNIVVALSGVLPSALVTTANIAFLGFGVGLVVSIVGEAAGAIISFVVYQYGLKKFQVPINNRFLKKLKDTNGAEAVFLVILLRIIPFVPSGIVTLTAAYSRMGLLSFSIASTVGKIPSLFIEAYSAKQVFNLPTRYQLIILFIIIFSYVIYKLFQKKRNASM